MSEATLLNHDGSAAPRHFAPWIQFAGVASYFGFDLVWRFLCQAVVSDGGQDEEVKAYDKPAMVTLCGYMVFILWGPILVFPYILFIRRMSIFDYYTIEWCGALGFWRAAKYTLAMTNVWFFANLMYITGLQFINVALSTALSQGEAPFTVGLSVLLLGRVFGTWEQRGIIFCFTGIAMITIPHIVRARNLNAEAGLGDEALTLISGVLSTLAGGLGFGIYQVFWPLFDSRRYPQDWRRPTEPQHAIVDTFATLTLVGAFCISLGWILLVFLHFIGWETFEVPPANIRGALAAASLVSALTDALNGVACVVATAVVVALAYPLTIPISVVLDYMINGIPIRSWGLLGWIGTLLVVAGVFCLETNPPGCDSAQDCNTTEDDSDTAMPTGTEERISACGLPDYGTDDHIGIAIPANSESKAEGLVLLRLEHTHRA
jgi:drug/metabolite transporter (DMT)-like permease